MSALIPHVPAALVDKLAKVAGLLGSDHDGERSAAAFRATTLIREAGLTWRQLIEAAGPRATDARSNCDALPGWRQQLQVIVDRSKDLTAWEAGFVRSTLAQGGKWALLPSSDR